MHGSIRIVDGFLRIALHERPARLAARVVARVGLRESEAELERFVALRHAPGIIERLARVAAVADHVEASVPFGRQAHLEGNLG